jgi:hypothetical protein
MVSVGGGGQPQWRSDQGELFYLSLDQAIMAVGVDAADPLRFGPPRHLFRPSTAGGPTDSRDSYGAAATGMRFLVDSVVNPSEDQGITVMVNWAWRVDEREPEAGRAAIAVE